MAWKKDENGAFVEDEHGNPVWSDKVSGSDKAVDFEAMSNALANTNAESAKRKAIIRDLEGKLGIFNGIDDLGQYKRDSDKALQFMANADANAKDQETLLQERIKAALEPANARASEFETRASTAEALVQKLMINDAFSASQYAKDKLVDPMLAKDLFAKNFIVQDGKVQALKDDGTIMYSANGEATFDEALPLLVEASRYKGVLLKGSPSAGSGANGNANTTGNYTNKPRRYADCKTSAERQAYLEDDNNLR